MLSMIKYIFHNTKIEVTIHSKSELSIDETQQIITEHHANPVRGHKGLNQIVKRIKTQFNWDTINDDVKQYVSKCPSCQINKTSNQNAKQPMVISTTPPSLAKNYLWMSLDHSLER